MIEIGYAVLGLLSLTSILFIARQKDASIWTALPIGLPLMCAAAIMVFHHLIALPANFVELPFVAAAALLLLTYRNMTAYLRKVVPARLEAQRKKPHS